MFEFLVLAAFITFFSLFFGFAAWIADCPWNEKPTGDQISFIQTALGMGGMIVMLIFLAMML